MGSGWKGKFGAVAGMIVGLIGLVAHFISPESGAAMEPNTALALIVGSFSLFGIRDKLG